MTTYARIVNGVAVDVSADPASSFAPDLAAEFVEVPDGVEPGSVLLAEIVDEIPSESDTVWKPRGTYIEEFEEGRFRYAAVAAAPAASRGVVTAQPVRRWITTLAFFDRFTDAEAIGFDLASIGATPEAAALRRYLQKANAASYIDLDRADTRAGVIALEDATLLGPGRALEILDAPIQDHEVYRG